MRLLPSSQITKIETKVSIWVDPHIRCVIHQILCMQYDTAIYFVWVTLSNLSLFNTFGAITCLRCRFHYVHPCNRRRPEAMRELWWWLLLIECVCGVSSYITISKLYYCFVWPHCQRDNIYFLPFSLFWVTQQTHRRNSLHQQAILCSKLDAWVVLHHMSHVIWLSRRSTWFPWSSELRC